MDFSRSLRLKSEMQLALDAAVLAAARVADDEQKSRAEIVFRENLGTTEVKVQGPNLKQSPTGELTGSATAKLDTTFASVLGIKYFELGVEAKVATRTSANPCILVLDPAASQSLLVNSGASIDAPDCEVHVKSTASPATIFNASSSLDTSRICIEGADIIDNGGKHPNTELKCKTASDPFAGTIPPPSTAACTISNANYSGAKVILNPGVYCGWINFNAGVDVEFNPGIYVIKDGGWNANGGKWTGKNVAFYFADQSKIQFNSAVEATLTPPSSGPYEGIIIFEADGLPRSPFVVDDSKGFELEGLIYLPSRDTIFNGGSNMTNKTLTMVVNTLILDETNWHLKSAAKSIGSGSGSKDAYLVK